MSIFDKQIDFLGKRKLFYGISATLFILSVISIIFRGLQFGIDFKGGTEIALQFEKPIQINDIRNEFNKLGIGNVEIKTFGGDAGVLLRTDLQEIPKSVFPKVTESITKAIDGIMTTNKRVVETTSNSVVIEFDSASYATEIY